MWKVWFEIYFLCVCKWLLKCFIWARLKVLIWSTAMFLVMSHALLVCDQERLYLQGMKSEGTNKRTINASVFYYYFFFLFFIFFINTTKEHYLQCHIYITYIKILEWNTLHITLLALQNLHQSVTHTDWHTRIIHSFPFEALHFVSKWKVTFLHISSDNYPRKLRDVIFSLVVFSTP